MNARWFLLLVACGGTVPAVDAGAKDSSQQASDVDVDVAPKPATCLGFTCAASQWDFQHDDAGPIGCEFAVCAAGDFCKLRDGGATGACVR